MKFRSSWPKAPGPDPDDLRRRMNPGHSGPKKATQSAKNFRKAVTQPSPPLPPDTPKTSAPETDPDTLWERHKKFLRP